MSKSVNFRANPLEKSNVQFAPYPFNQGFLNQNGKSAAPKVNKNVIHPSKNYDVVGRNDKINRDYELNNKVKGPHGPDSNRLIASFERNRGDEFLPAANRKFKDPNFRNPSQLKKMANKYK